MGVETVSPVWDCSAPLSFAQPPRRGTLTAGQTRGLRADEMAMLIVKTMAMAGMWEGVPAQKLRVRLGHVSDLRQGGKANWVDRSVSKSNFDLRPFPKMSLNVTLGDLSAHR